MIYDYIIIGAGLGGLSSGLNLALNNKKVLILEKNSLPGGLASTFKRGRFEFDATNWNLYDYGNDEHVGEIRKLFYKYGLYLNTKLIPFNSRIKVLDSKEDYEINGEFEEFVLLLEQKTPGSIEPLREFIKITKEIHDAKECLITKTSNAEENYPNFTKYLSANTIDALTDLKMPRDTINRLCYFWIEIGSPINKLSFIDFADFMYKIIFKKTVILNDKNISLALEMTKRYQVLGGKIYFNSEVVEIAENNMGTLDIKTRDNKEYKAKHVICDMSKRYVFKNLIKNPNKEINRLENARTISPNGLYVYLGLNQNHQSLNLNNYHYYQFNTLNSEENVSKMNTLKHNTFEAIVPNVVCDNASPENTTILVLRTSYYGNVFDKVNKNNYYSVKEELANDLITKFETAFNLDIKEYIEEIEIATPFTFERLTNNINGAFLGYMRLGYDNSIHRLISEEDELLKNISFVGSSSIFGGGFDNVVYSGYYITEKLLNAKGSEQNGE